MKRLIVVLLVATLASPSGWTCSCDDKPPPEIALEQSAAVFVGHVVSLKFEVHSGNDGIHREIVCVFDDLERFKGVAEHEDQVTVRTNAEGTACGFQFRINDEYLVYATTRGDEVLRTSVCERTKPLIWSPAEDSEDAPVNDSGLQEADLLRALLKK